MPNNKTSNKIIKYFEKIKIFSKMLLTNNNKNGIIEKYQVNMKAYFI